jgi:RHS repeat-associated protein
MIFDKNFVFKTGGFKRLSDLPKENGTDVAHEKLAFEGAERIIVKEPGYVYIYLSNENDTPVEVYFDDFRVRHRKGPIVSSQDYYPFGLTFNSYQRENSIQQPYQYNGKEIQDELNLQWMDYGARMYDAQIGRWHVVDPLSLLFADWSPYTYAYNNPTRYTDPYGMANEDEVKKDEEKEKQAKKDCDCGGEEVYREEYTGKDGKKHVDIYYASANSGGKEGNEEGNKSSSGENVGGGFVVNGYNPESQKGNQNGPNNDKHFQNMLFTAAGAQASIGGLVFSITDKHISDGIVYANLKGAKLIKFGAGPGSAIVSVIISGTALMMLDEVAPHDKAKFITSLVITGTAFIPGVGPVISLGLTLADSIGAFDDFYNFFDDPNKNAKPANFDIWNSPVMKR